MGQVIDIKTRAVRMDMPPQPLPAAASDGERVDALVGNCETMMLRSAQMLRAAVGLDAALRAIGRVTQAIRGG